ncbi:MAG: ATP-binding protein [Bacteroidales bacterium]|nr:ATP-binding protein [Bacteroidales bacterium]
MGQRRYPGATPFRGDQAKIFYGRDRDIEKMLTLIQVEKMVLLYSKSGLGKTSLLEAGIIPKLPLKFSPISIRFYASSSESISPVQRVVKALEKAIGGFGQLPQTILDHLDNDGKPDQSLWYYFKKLQFAGLTADPEKNQKTFLLVFDQFEELFSYAKEEVTEFKNQFYELTEQTVPDRYASRIASARRNNRELFTREALALLHKRIDVKTIFAIRSDRLHLLNNLSDKITNIQHVFYEIKSLDIAQATQAVVKPAQDKDSSFDTKPYSFDKDAIEKIISELSDGGKQSIETTQLQIVCHRIEDIAEEKSKTTVGEGSVEIEVKDLPEFKNIFLNFYNDSINKLPEKDQANAKRLIEDELIRSKQRISLDENICREYIDEFQLKALVDTHLLRAEQNSFGRFSFELSHDTLVEPILESQKKYKDEQEKIALKKKQAEELKKLEAKREQEKQEREEELERIKAEQDRKEKERIRRRRWQRTILAVISFSLLVSLYFGYLSVINYCDASKERDKALVKEQEAIQNLIKFKDSQFSGYCENAETAKDNGDYKTAIENYYVAKTWIHTDITLTVKDSSSKCNFIEYSKKQFGTIIPDASKNRKLDSIAKVFEGKKELARNDSTHKVDSINQIIDTCNLLLSKAGLIKNLLYQATLFRDKKLFIEALKKIKEAHQLDPNYPGISTAFVAVKEEAKRMYGKSRDDYKEVGNFTKMKEAESLLETVTKIKL